MSLPTCRSLTADTLPAAVQTVSGPSVRLFAEMPEILTAAEAEEWASALLDAAKRAREGADE